MDWTYLFYFFLGGVLFFGAKSMGKGSWNGEYTSLQQTKVLQGIAALGVALHHLAQKSCAPWHAKKFIVHGLDPFVPMGYMLVGVFLFCSGLGLYKSFKSKPDYLKGFVRRRILPVVIAFYLSEFIYTAVRLAMGEKMDAVTILWYLSGLHMANFNAWYVIVIPFFYLAFWAAFRFCKREGTAILWVFLFTLGYTVLGAFIDHQSDWWMRGEWWYNSILLFPLGLLFAKHEEKITRIFRKGYWFFLLLFFAGIFLLFRQSEWLVNNRLGYYGEWGDPLKVVHRLLSAGTQWVVAIFFVMFCFLLMMKIRLGNRVLAWLGAVSLDFYLMHGIFVELFGYNFLDISDSIVYIRQPALFTAAVLACSVPATLLFRWLRMKITPGKKQGPEAAETAKRKSLADRIRERREHDAAYGKSLFRRLLVPVITAVLLIGGYFLLQSGMGGDRRNQILNGMQVTAPEGFVLQHADSVSVLWKYSGEDKKVGYLVLDAEIPDANSRDQDTLENIYEKCDWLTGKEYYTNPQGIRMVRGMTDISGSPERRYYIDSTKDIMVLRMIENDRYYDTAACEAAMQQTADSMKPVR